MNEIPNRLASVRERIRQAATESGRDPAEVALLAVSKTKPIADIEAAIAAGQQRFGENYLQEAVPKITALAGTPLEWHFIGRIQGNKSADISRHFAWVHGLDNYRHAELLDRHRADDLAPLQVCLQVNLSAQSSKGGTDPENLQALAESVSALPRLCLRGLMTLPDPDTSPTVQRSDFARLRDLRDTLNDKGLTLDTLSMGTSADLEMAIAEGSTLVRIGTDIFGPRS